MRRLCVAAAVVMMLGAGASQAWAQRQVTLLMTVTDPGGSVVTTLDPGAVQIVENGAPATVAKVEPILRTSKVQILVDNGLGIGPEGLADLRKGLVGLIEALPPDIETAIVTTAPQPRFIEKGTTDRATLLSAVSRIAIDRGAGRFVESLFEATQRVEREKDTSHVIVSIATSTGDTDVRDGDLKKIQERLRTGRIRVFVALVAGGSGRSLGGNVQESVAEVVAPGTGGIYQKINVVNRLVTLLPEYGKTLAESLGPASRQFRVTVDRPAGASGALGSVSLVVTGKTVTSVMVEPR